MEKRKYSSKKKGYAKLEEDEDVVLPKLGLARRSVEISKAAYNPGLLLPTLKQEEQDFFALIDADNPEDVNYFLQSRKSFNINCQNFGGETPLTRAVSEGDIDIIETILSHPKVIVGDAILHAIDEGDTAIITAILDKLTKDGHDERASCYTESPDYSPDMTPIMLAAINENYEVVRLLLKRGHFVEKPHPPNCFCNEECYEKRLGESLRDSVKRLNTYKALASAAYVCQSSPDPILTAFKLSREFILISKIERELVDEYVKLSGMCKKFALDLLVVTRTTDEVSTLLKRKEGYMRRKPVMFSRLVTAVDYLQTEFVAHHNTQLVLRAAWLCEWQDWKSLSNAAKFCRVISRIVLLPFMAILYMIAPNLKCTRNFKTPINKFISTAASYSTFLVFLLVHNRIDGQTQKRGPPNTGLEYVIGMFVFGMIWAESKKMWYYGCSGFFQSKWNTYTVFMLMTFLASFGVWIWSYFELEENGDADLERRYWNAYDPSLVGEGLFALATTMAFIKLLYFLQINNNLGPLEVSISRMYKDMLCFMALFVIILLSYSAGISKLYQYYIDQMYLNVHGIKIAMIHHFDTFEHTMYTLFWSLFAMSPVESANVILSPIKRRNSTEYYINTHEFTQAIGHFLFATYHVVTIIILLNLLIGMMANSFQKVADNADMEWKFARTRVWLSYFEEGGTLPPPFNILPTPKAVARFFYWLHLYIRKHPIAKFTRDRCCHFDDEKVEGEGDYQLVMARLVQRYLRIKERRKDLSAPTLDDISRLESEIKEIKTAITVGTRPMKQQEGE